MKIRPLEVALFHANTRRGGLKMMTLKFSLCSSIAPKIGLSACKKTKHLFC
jgi:hypothetical protein